MGGGRRGAAGLVIVAAAVMRHAAWTVLLAVAACQTAPPTPPPVGSVPPARAPNQGRTSNRVVLTLFGGSPTGLIVGSGPADGNPGLRLPDLVFSDHPDPPGSYLWAFTRRVELLDRDCHPITQADAIALANTPGANSVIVIDYLGADGRPTAPAKLQFWARASGGVADCQSEEDHVGQRQGKFSE